MKLILFFVRLILSTRYKVTLNWAENLQHNWPILLLPNHQALVDPRILISFLGKYLIASPVASEKYYNLPILKQAMDLVWTVPIWEMTAWASPEEVKKVFASIVEWLKKWKNILIYPSGQVYRQNFESIKWKQSAYYIAKNMPENTKVLWLRQRWLWWSIWSKAWDNWQTDFVKAYVKSIQYVLANFIFFAPKRKISIEIEDITEAVKTYRNMSLNEFNGFLQNFYNREPEETLVYLKHYFYFDDVKNKKEPELITGSEKELSQSQEYDISQISDEVKEKISEKVRMIKGVPQNNTSFDWKTNLILDLFFDSLDLAEIKSYIQANFVWASNPPITSLKTLWDLYIMAVWKSQSVEKLKECVWGKMEKGKLI